VILFVENGRLGNQLFQYCGLKQYFPEHKIFFVGCGDLQKHFDSVDARFVPINMLVRWFSFGVLSRFIYLLADIGVFCLVREREELGFFKLAVRKGLFWNIYVPRSIYFQRRDVVDKIKAVSCLKPDLIQFALDWLHKKGIDPDLRSVVFVHIRRGDYLHWPSNEFPAVLDLAWYKRAMKSMLEKIKNPVFIFMSDDLFYLRDVFDESERLVISDNPPEIDMALMSHCHSGILSASSFAWWGAFYARSNQKQDGTFLAPRYWCGNRAKKWIPTNFRTNWITYIE